MKEIFPSSTPVYKITVLLFMRVWWKQENNHVFAKNTNDMDFQSVFS
jgi:hypothetical protein